jgi:HD domain
MPLDDITVPETPAAFAADQVARRYCSSALYAHCVRSFVWGVAYARGAALSFDLELFYVAALLHDIGLTRPFDAHEMAFEDAGGQLAWVFAAGAGWSDARRDRVAEVIEKHMWPSVDPAEDTEGHLLEIATGIDISGRGVDLLPSGLQRAVIGRWPRLGLADEFAECLLRQGERKPASRAADLVRTGVADALRNHPLEHVAPPGGGG